MSREIKFRGTREDNGDWVFGSFIPDALEGSNSDLISWGFIKRYNRGIGKMETIEVDRETVGQYTGLKDKNGEEIYEGDIVTGLDSIPSMIKAWGWDIKVGEVCYVVTWHEGKYHLNKLDGTIGWIINWHISSKVKDLSVIGNIHENPELLSSPTPREQIPDGGMEE